MSGTKFSVVSNFPKSFSHFPPPTHQLATSSLVDSPEACTPLEGEELEGLVSVPGSESDFQIKDIPIVTALDVDESDAPSMQYMKPISPSVPPTQEYYTNYLTSACSSPDTSSMEAACPPTTRDFDHMYASLSRVDTTALMAENVHLKEMLVTQLDLIQQQSETILSRDKQLKLMRDENALLLQKLQRMERRVKGEVVVEEKSMVRKRSRDRSDILDKLVKKRKASSDRGGVTVVGEERVTTWPVQDRARTLHDSVADTFDHRDDELTDEFIGDSEHSLASEHVEKDADMTRPDTPTSATSEDTLVNKEEAKQRPTKRARKVTETGVRKIGGNKSQSPAVAEKYQKNRRSKVYQAGSAPEIVQILESQQLYYVGCKNDILPCAEDQLTEVPALQRGVEVPSWREDKNHYNLLVQTKFSLKKSKDKETPTWRIKSTNPCYSMEGTEDISDHVLLKRHEKMEKDEKQRKRWDMQRMRQEQQLQKLRARQEKQHAAQTKKEETTSLLPSLEAATHICVEEKIPVAAFGRPIPSLPHANFNLPWVESATSKTRVKGEQ